MLIGASAFYQNTKSLNIMQKDINIVILLIFVLFRQVWFNCFISKKKEKCKYRIPPNIVPWEKKWTEELMWTCDLPEFYAVERVYCSE